MGDTQRRVLKLRSGVGPGQPLSRGQTARRLGLSSARVARIEQRGLHRLAGLGRAGACAPAGSSSASSSVSSPGASLDPGGPAGGDPVGSGARGAVKGVSAHGAGDRDDSGVPLPPSPPGKALVALAFALGLLALVYLVRRELLRR